MCPNYGYECSQCGEEIDLIRPMDQREQPVPCPECYTTMTLQLSAPTVLRHSYPDGTKRFDKVRQSRALERAERAEKDKAQKKRLRAERARLVTKESA